jgi:hypothetical protein
VTPEAQHIVSELRREFYLLFAASMHVPIRITGVSYSSNSPIASWVNERQQLNYLNVYAYTAPDELIPLRPLILRLAINRSALRATILKKRQEYQVSNRFWSFELTVLPEEILDFLPWIVNLVQTRDKNSPSLIISPPHPFKIQPSVVELFNEVWTQKAWLLSHSTIAYETLSP